MNTIVKTHKEVFQSITAWNPMLRNNGLLLILTSFSSGWQRPSHTNCHIIHSWYCLQLEWPISSRLQCILKWKISGITNWKVVCYPSELQCLLTVECPNFVKKRAQNNVVVSGMKHQPSVGSDVQWCPSNFIHSSYKFVILAKSN